MLVAFGDCAVTGNVPAMRNPFGVQAVLERAYVETAQPACSKCLANGDPALLRRVRPVHEVVKVEFPARLPAIRRHSSITVLDELLAGRTPDIAALAALRSVGG